jgi:hypothetical protein
LKGSAPTNNPRGESHHSQFEVVRPESVVAAGILPDRDQSIARELLGAVDSDADDPAPRPSCSHAVVSLKLMSKPRPERADPQDTAHRQPVWSCSIALLGMLLSTGMSLIQESDVLFPPSAPPT